MTPLRAPVAVVGAGPAGVTVALELCRAGVEVVVVAGGGGVEGAADLDANTGAPARGPWGHEALTENRRRVVGGASVAWGGRCVPLDPVDFEERAWIPHSGWPIAYDDYRAWWPRAAEILDIGAPRFAEQGGPGLPEAGGPAPELTRDGLERWSTPVNFARVLREDPDLLARATLLERASVVRIERSDDGRARRLVVRRAGSDDLLEVEADHYVLAAGALENARLLLDSDFAESLPALGRYYLSHTFPEPLALTAPAGVGAATAFHRDRGIYCRRRWALARGAQEAEEVGNATLYFGRPPGGSLGVHRNPTSSFVHLAKIALTVAAGPGVRGRAARLAARRGEIREHAAVLRAARPGDWWRLVRMAALRLRRRRLPEFLPHHGDRRQFLVVQAEHLPHPDSRVSLADDVDGSGQRRLQVEPEFARGDFETVAVAMRAAARLCDRHGWRLDRPVETSWRAWIRSMYGGFNSNAHHAGTTRMGHDLRSSVVDEHGRLHTADNVHVAGSSVFPTSGHANPTFTIVALSARLGQHLASRIHDEVSEATSPGSGAATFEDVTPVAAPLGAPPDTGASSHGSPPCQTPDHARPSLAGRGPSYSSSLRQRR